MARGIRKPVSRRLYRFTVPLLLDPQPPSCTDLSMWSGSRHHQFACRSPQCERRSRCRPEQIVKAPCHVLMLGRVQQRSCRYGRAASMPGDAVFGDLFHVSLLQRLSSRWCSGTACRNRQDGGHPGEEQRCCVEEGSTQQERLSSGQGLCVDVIKAASSKQWEADRHSTLSEPVPG
jgi:hypothetical protein